MVDLKKNRKIILVIFFLTVICLCVNIETVKPASIDVIDLSDEDPPSTGNGWTYSNNVYTVLDGASVTVCGNSSGSSRCIQVNSSSSVTLTIDNVTMDGPVTPITVSSNATLNLNLVGTNTFKPSGWSCGINVPPNATLTIDGTGSLYARSNTTTYWNGAAAIGGKDSSCGTIIINGGTIEAVGPTEPGAAIGGGGTNKNGGEITINGGSVIATCIGGCRGAAIGGGGLSSCDSVSINGGTVTATGSRGAGIGGGDGNSGTTGNGMGNITITGGTVVTSRIGVGNYPSNRSGLLKLDGNGVLITKSFNGADSEIISGVYMINDVGQVYGSEVTPTENFELSANQKLSIPDGCGLNLTEKITVTNNGSIVPEDGSTVTARGTVLGNLINGANISDLVLDSVTENSAKLGVPNLKATTGQSVEYATSTEDSVPSDGWQDDPYFTELNSNTKYYFFARSKGNSNFYAGAVKSNSDWYSVKIGIDMGTAAMNDDNSYSFPNLTLSGIDIKFPNGGYFSVDVNNGRVELGSDLAENFSLLGEDGILFDGETYNVDTEQHKTVNIPPNSTLDIVQEQFKKYKFYKDSDTVEQKITISVLDGSNMKAGFSDITNIGDKYYRYVAYSEMGYTSTERTFATAIKVASKAGGILIEPKTIDEIKEIGRYFYRYCNSSNIWNGYKWNSFLGLTTGKVTYDGDNSSYITGDAPSERWTGINYASTGEQVPFKDDGIDDAIIYKRNSATRHYVYMVNDDDVKILGVELEHGSNGNSDAGVIVQYDNLSQAGQRSIGEEEKIVSTVLPKQLTTYVKNGRILNDISSFPGSEINMSSNDIFTVQFKTSTYHYLSDDNAPCKLMFNRNLPLNTKITFVDYSNGIPQFYYYIVDDEKSSINLTQFNKMATDNNCYDEVSANYMSSSMLFMIDFSDVDKNNLFNEGSMLNTSFSIDNKTLSGISTKFSTASLQSSGSINYSSKGININAKGNNSKTVYLFLTLLDKSEKQLCLNSNNSLSLSGFNGELCRGGLLIDLGQANTNGKNYALKNINIANLPSNDYKYSLSLFVTDPEYKHYPLSTDLVSSLTCSVD